MKHLNAPLYLVLFLTCLLSFGIAQAQDVNIEEACSNQTITHTIPVDSAGQLKISIKCTGDWYVLLGMDFEVDGDIFTQLGYLVINGMTEDTGEMSYAYNANITERKVTLKTVSGDQLSMKFNFDLNDN